MDITINITTYSPTKFLIVAEYTDDDNVNHKESMIAESNEFTEFFKKLNIVEFGNKCIENFKNKRIIETKLATEIVNELDRVNLLTKHWDIDGGPEPVIFMITSVLSDYTIIKTKTPYKIEPVVSKPTEVVENNNSVTQCYVIDMKNNNTYELNGK